jgi:hypothetical protein
MGKNSATTEAQILPPEMERVIFADDPNIPSYSSVCMACKHWQVAGRTCDAYPVHNSIPLEIWLGKNDHRQPFPGDNGIQFEPLEVSTATSISL